MVSGLFGVSGLRVHSRVMKAFIFETGHVIIRHPQMEGLIAQELGMIHNPAMMGVARVCAPS